LQRRDPPAGFPAAAAAWRARPLVESLPDCRGHRGPVFRVPPACFKLSLRWLSGTPSLGSPGSSGGGVGGAGPLVVLRSAGASHEWLAPVACKQTGAGRASTGVGIRTVFSDVGGGGQERRPLAAEATRCCRPPERMTPPAATRLL
jgi:hypothetical protein